jgi:hypothetical protein
LLEEAAPAHFVRFGAFADVENLAISFAVPAIATNVADLAGLTALELAFCHHQFSFRTPECRRLASVANVSIAIVRASFFLRG